MIHTLYIENAVRQHPRVMSLCRRFPQARQVICERYSEVFNPKAQNFRLQKQRPALILAEKYNNHVLPAPPGYGIGAAHNFYFSHMLNCLYDCRYCFLQGMYQSANYVLFVNFETYQQAISEVCEATPDQPVHFFSGYDCDSLALEPVTGFAQQFLPFFATLPNAWLELRTKSTQIRTLLNREPDPRCIVAFSLSPDDIAQTTEHKAPSLNRRLEAIDKLQQRGWKIGLRFDPIIYQSTYQQDYSHFFQQVFSRIQLTSLHSVSLGVFRLPEKYFKKIYNLYPEEKIFAAPLTTKQRMTSYRAELEEDILQFCRQQILNHIPQSLFYPCTL